MFNKKLFEPQDIARSNFLWQESKTRINIALTAALLLALVCTILYL